MVIALVDYDNAIYLQEKNEADVGFNLSQLLASLATFAREKLGRIDELRVLLYGGWLVETGAYSDRAQWILATIGRFRGRRNGMRVLPSLVTALAVRPTDNLIGSYRVNTVPRRQKMVDCMIAVDAMYFVRSEDAPLIIVSDDDDLVPAVIGIRGCTTQPVFLVRKRPQGEGLNDSLLAELAIGFGSLPED
ncbi:MAG TPA: hypothetical protein VGO40_24380 [Longimicrobium sp.]|nr:hypothetical protein [Longimicrobium sp.]